MKVGLTKIDKAPADGLVAAVEAGFSTDLAWWDARCDSRRYSVIRSRDNIAAKGAPDWRWHISVAGQSDVPKWRDLVALAHEIRPGIFFVVGVPPKSLWMNVHPHCLHLLEFKDENLMAQWRFEGGIGAPS